MAWAKPTLFNEEFLTSSRNYANCENTPLQMFRKDFEIYSLRSKDSELSVKKLTLKKSSVTIGCTSSQRPFEVAPRASSFLPAKLTKILSISLPRFIFNICKYKIFSKYS